MTNKDLNIAHLNIRSIIQKSKQIILNDFLITNNIHIISLNETHLKEKNSFDLIGYKIYRKDREGDKKGGGVALIVANTVNHDEYDVNTDKNTEIIAIKIKIKNTETIIISYYIPPNADTDMNETDKLLQQNKNILIMGDFNAKSQLWYCKDTNTRGDKLESLIEKHNLNIHNNETPTFNYSNNVIDLILSSPATSKYVHDFTTNEEIPSDHKMLQIKIIDPKPEQNHTKNMTNWKKYKNLLLNAQFEKINKESDINIIAQDFENQIIKAQEESQEIINKQNKIKVLPPQIVKIIKEKRKLRNQYIKTRDKELKTKINKISNQIKNEIEKYEETKWEKLCNEARNDHQKSASMWRKIKNMNSENTTKHRKIKIKIGINETPNDHEITNHFAKTLEETFNIDTNKFKCNKEAPNATTKNDFQESNKITLKELNDTINKLPKRKAAGVDNILYEHITNLPETARTQLLQIYNLSLQTGTIPDRWKLSKIKMVPKPKKPLAHASSYRPISLTSNIAKCLEKIILKRVTSSLETLGSISIYQSGFRSHHSTKDHILRLSQNIQNGFNKNQYTGSVMFDMEKAFDKVWHQGLLYKLNQIGLPSYIIHWIFMFITNRQFFVSANECDSNKIKTKAGVPQGCILSPILFSIYFSDISKIIKVEKGIFADDLAIWNSATTTKKIEQALQADIYRIENFCNEWCLKINSLKTSYTIFTNAGKRKNYEKLYAIDLKYENKNINIDPNPQFLGIVFDPKLSFNAHTESIIPKVTSRTNILRILKGKYWKSNPKILVKLYKTLIRPIFEYANFPFLSAPESTIRKIQILENKILRICLHSDWKQTTAEVHNLANLETIKQRLMKTSTNYITRILNYKSNIPIMNLLHNQEQVESENLQITLRRSRKSTCLDEFKCIYS